jgi:hypothetical protein
MRLILGSPFIYIYILRKKFKSKYWRKFGLEFLSIFIAVTSAFALNNWNENRISSHSEQKILSEIKNSLKIDAHDFNKNIYGNRWSLKADSIFRSLLNGDKINQDSIALYYTILFRDYIPIVNRSAYESLKANNLKTVENDSLRIQIISLYDYYYSIIEKLEYEVPEMKSYKNYFSRINQLLHPSMQFDSNGELKKIVGINQLNSTEKQEILSYLWRMRNNRKFKLDRYDLILNEMKKLELNIEKELKLN